MSRPLTLVRADLFVAAVAPLGEDDGPFARPWAGKDRHLETAVIVSPLDVPVAGTLAILKQECWVVAGYAHIELTPVGQKRIEAGLRIRQIQRTPKRWPKRRRHIYP
jgi:hypothetical protein